MTGLALWIFAVGVAAVQDGKKEPPGDEAQARAIKQIRDIFKDEYALKTVTGQRKLAALLLKQGRETNDDGMMQYALFREAADVAGRSGEVDALLGSLEALSKGFNVDALTLKGAALMKAEPAITAPEDLKQLAEALIGLTRDALTQEQFDPASKTAQTALGSARRSKDLALVVRADGIFKSVQETKGAWEKARAAEQTLLTTPEDPVANQNRGEYLCFFKNQWDQGLVFLSMGSDAPLRALAVKEIAAPTETVRLLEIADGWWEISGAEKSVTRKNRIRSHARSCYEHALPAATGLHRIRIENRIAEGMMAQGGIDAPVQATRDGLVAWWKCDEGKGQTVADSSGANHEATLVNVEWTTGHKGTGLKFSGTNSYVACKSATFPATNAAQTISWWHYRLNGATGGNMIVLSNDTQTAAVQIGMGKGTVGIWKLGGEPVLSAPDPQISTWTHCAYSFDGKTHTVYISGKLVASCDVSPQVGVPARCELGRWWGTVGSGYYTGLLDEIRIYNRALPAPEISLLASGRD